MAEEWIGNDKIVGQRRTHRRKRSSRLKYGHAGIEKVECLEGRMETKWETEGAD